MQWEVQTSSTSQRGPRREACAQRVHSLGDQNTALAHALLPGPSPGTHHLYPSSPSSKHLGWASTAVQGEQGESSTLSLSPPKLPWVLVWIRELLRGQKGRKDSAAIRCDPGCCFSGGNSPHKGPFVFSFPWPSAALFSPEKSTMGHCAQQKGAPCPASSSLGSQLPLRVCPGWARPLKRSARNSCSHVSSILGADRRGRVQGSRGVDPTDRAPDDDRLARGSTLAHSA